MIATTLAALAQGLRAIPDHMERKLGIDGDLAGAISGMIDAEMDALAQRLGALSSDESELDIPQRN